MAGPRDIDFVFGRIKQHAESGRGHAAIILFPGLLTHPPREEGLKGGLAHG